MNIKMMRMISGDIVVSEVRNYGIDNIEQLSAPRSSEFVIFKNPATLAPTQQGIALVPWLMFSEDQEIKIMTNHIMIYYEHPEQNIINAYSQQFGSGIIIPKNKLAG